MEESLDKMKLRLDIIERAIVRIDGEILRLKDNREFMRKDANRLIDTIEAHKES